MIEIRDIHKDNFWEVGELTSNVDGMVAVLDPLICFKVSPNTESYDDTKYIPKAVYWNDRPIGFFMYKQSDVQIEKIEIFDFMLDRQSIGRGLGQASFQAILRYAKALGKTTVSHGRVEDNTFVKSLYTSLGFILGRSFHEDTKVI